MAYAVLEDGDAYTVHNVTSIRPLGDPIPSLDGHEKAAHSEPDPLPSMPEFFSHSVFRTALYNPIISHQLLKFCQARLCGENIEFLARVHLYRQMLQHVSTAIAGIHADFFSPDSLTQINVPESVVVRVKSDIKSSMANAMPKLEGIFNSAQTDIEQLVYGIYPSFVRSQMSLSATKALGGDRSRYGGLGDCFILTDPSKADNPIVFASDGFVRVTGYARMEIIPRNCRFLQSLETDMSVVRRIREGIDKHEEVVELLLNQRKDGEPFWNLLYITPLFDANGRLVHCLGAQINCSTTVHSTSDVLRILAQSEDRRPDLAPSGELRSKASGGRRLFRTTSRTMTPSRQPPGMEDELLNQLTGMPLQKQFRTFYSAYSNFIVVHYTTLLITSVSSGMAEIIFPAKSKMANHPSAAGTDIFQFLGSHAPGWLSSDFQSSVKAALKGGTAISVPMTLYSRPDMALSKFVCHWTPLKDEKGAVAWVVLTLGQDQRG
ncbi:hypothetical protein BDY17DRAFT_294483 [Neohortaea acidophila]|uniref:PAC domain-containing protein n=1 Tax=Neohortaea acidophila TaxID=245834 RepID=A0A6A6PUN2_9PEZI|nr:uncharacterized protein BDY17DRAFT_294483 [Neohortaea acidophila]KAF2483818.1 hypothetical protein BDY17DRAFT_294483 [Neohortaea acidophila]